jgi:hypothetical protein
MICIVNQDEDFILYALAILDEMGVGYNLCERYNRKSLSPDKIIYEIQIQSWAQVKKLVPQIHYALVVKGNRALAMLGLAVIREETLAKGGYKAPWSQLELDIVTGIRKFLLVRSKRVYGETLTDDEGLWEAIRIAYDRALPLLRAIPSEASGSTEGTEEPLESRSDSSASDDPTHERPATQLRAVGGEPKMCSDPGGDPSEGGNPSTT